MYMHKPPVKPETQFPQRLAGIDIGAPQPDFAPLEQWLAEVLELEPQKVLAANISGSPVVAPLLSERLSGRQVRLLLAVVSNAAEMEDVERAIAQFIARDSRLDVAAICSLGKYNTWHIATIVCRGGDGLGARVKDQLAPTARIAPPVATPAAATRGPGGAGSAGPIVMDDRIMRMVRLAMASSSAVVLVGPPGTGKTSIIKHVLEEIAHNPAAFGLAKAPTEPKWVTPSESWTSVDLVGGQVPDPAGRQHFRLGHVLEAVRDDRWLILDEANRANMDRIFGGMLTWLSDQKVELGRASADFNAPPVVLDWNTRPESETVRLELLEADTIISSEPIRFRAGMDWRLLGTYNAQDSAKVFTFGQALGRRFSRVPIPAIDAGDFRKALAPLARDIPPDVSAAIAGLYKAHRASRRCQLGPAVFLKMASYVTAGMKLPQLRNVTTGIGPSAAPASDDVLMQLLAEAYISSAGPWLAPLGDDELAELGAQAAAAGLPEAEWQWIVSLVPTLG
jgi:MoxR-like ATPase